MAVIQWNASPAGHYSENSIAISSEETFYLNNGSYNDKTFPVSHIGISAAGNSAITVITFSDGSSFTVSPFTNSLIEVAGRESCVVVNDGDAVVKVTLMDLSHAKAYGSQYTQPPWQAATSLNELLYHFSEDPIKNYGFDKQATAAQFPSETLTTTGGVFTTNGYCSGDGTINAGFGFAFTDSLGFGVGQPFTIDFWIRPQGVQGTSEKYILTLTDNAALASDNTLIGFTTNQWVCAGGTVGATTLFPANGSWTHLALVLLPSKNSISLYVNGVFVGFGNSVNPATNLLYLQTKTAGVSVNVKPLVGDITEFRVTNRAVWLSNFTPPNAPYT